jgi:hypothetical protein
VVWTGENVMGVEMPSGVYFYRLRFGESVETRKMVMLK